MAALIDESAFEDYETWKAAKLAGATDLSPRAYNEELRAKDVAFQMGAKALFKQARLWDVRPGASKPRFEITSPYTGETFEVS